MSDDDYETTAVEITKPKRERTPAQKAATARALEALAAAREAKKAKPVTVLKRTTTTTKTLPRPAEKNIIVHEGPEYDELLYAKPKPSVRPTVPRGPPAAPVHRAPTAREAPALPDYGEDIRSLTEGLHGVLTYIQRKETKKTKKAPVPVESSSEEEEEEPEPVRRPVHRKSKPSKAPPPAPEYQFGHKDPQEILRSLFFRNN